MKAITFKIGKKVSKELLKNVYQLRVHYMHGDADAYTDEDRVYKQHDPEMNTDIALLTRIQERYNGGDDDVHKLAKEEGEKLGLTKAQIDTFTDTFVVWDSTSSYSHYAAIDGVTLTWFDDNGEEYEVEVVYA